MGLPTRYGIVKPYNLQNIYQLSCERRWAVTSPYKSLFLFNENYYDCAGLHWNGNGSAQISTTAMKFGAGSLYLPPSTTSYLASPLAAASQNFVLGTQFCIDTWVRFAVKPGASGGAESQIVGRHSWPGSYTWILLCTTTALIFYGAGSNVTRSFTWELDTWYHIEVSRDASNNLRMFVDGTQLGETASFTGDLSATTYAPTIGSSIGGAGCNLYGYIDMFRIRAAGGHTGNFTPPASESEY